MTNILGDDRKRQVLALGRLGWPLRRIEQATGVRRETASAYLKAAGITIRAARHRRPPPNPASPVSTDPAKPASVVSTDPGPLPRDVADVPAWPPPTSRAPKASACEPYRELIELALGRGRNAVSTAPERLLNVGHTSEKGSYVTCPGTARASPPVRPP